jgi:hypothetical protein
MEPPPSFNPVQQFSNPVPQTKIHGVPREGKSLEGTDGTFSSALFRADVAGWRL